MHRACIAMAFLVSSVPASGARGEEPASGSEFLVSGPKGRIAVLRDDGAEFERIEPASWNADFSPDGEWLAYSEPIPHTHHTNLIIRSRETPGKNRTEIPLIWGGNGTACIPLWDGDSKSLLIAESGWNENGQRLAAYRVFDLHRKTILELNIPDRYFVCDWSAAEQRLLVTIRGTDHPSRLAWVNVDGSGDPEYITSTGEYSDRGRISPEGRRILCQIAPKIPPGARPVIRLFVIDLATGNRTIIDEPGQTDGHCWCPDGTRVAYTWQPTLDHPEQMSLRETLLITCNADGSDRKVVARREHTIPSSSPGRSGYPIFFRLLDWR